MCLIVESYLVFCYAYRIFTLSCYWHYSSPAIPYFINVAVRLRPFESMSLIVWEQCYVQLKMGNIRRQCLRLGILECFSVLMKNEKILTLNEFKNVYYKSWIAKRISVESSSNRKLALQKVLILATFSNLRTFFSDIPEIFTYWFMLTFDVVALLASHTSWSIPFWNDSSPVVH